MNYLHYLHIIHMLSALENPEFKFSIGGFATESDFIYTLSGHIENYLRGGV